MKGFHEINDTIGPIQLMPDDILREIFLNLLPAELEDCRPTRSQAPLLLCQICSRWRAIALSTPKLWSSLCIELSRDDNENEGEVNENDEDREEGEGEGEGDNGDGGEGEGAEVSEDEDESEHPVKIAPSFKTLVEEWFHRLGPDMALSLCFVTPYLNDSDNPAIEEVTRCILLPHSNRLRELSLRFSIEGIPVPPVPIICFPLVHTEQLEGLSLVLDSEDIHMCSFTLTSAPRLRRVILRHILPIFDAVERFFPWPQLTSLEIGTIGPSLLRTILAHCVSLEHGNFTVLVSADAFTAINFVLSRLSDLRIRFVGGGDPSFFNGLEFPALRNFHVMTDETRSRFSWTHTGHLYDQLRNLTHLSLAGGISDIVGLLRHTTSITRLTVASNDYLDSLWHAMTCKDEAPLVPKLEVLQVRPYGFKEISLSWAPSFSCASFAAMVLSRTRDRVPPGVSPLRQLVFEGNDDHLFTVKPLLYDLEGLDALLPIITFKEEDVRLDPCSINFVG